MPLKKNITHIIIVAITTSFVILMNACGKKIETEDLTLLPMPQQITLADGWFNDTKRELSTRRELHGTKTISDTPE